MGLPEPVNPFTNRPAEEPPPVDPWLVTRCTVGPAPGWLGVVTLGVVTVGVVAFGVVAWGIVTFGVVAWGVVTLGVVATGVLTFGVVAWGVLTCGTETVGTVAVGVGTPVEGTVTVVLGEGRLSAAAVAPAPSSPAVQTKKKIPVIRLPQSIPRASYLDRGGPKPD